MGERACDELSDYSCSSHSLYVKGWAKLVSERPLLAESRLSHGLLMGCDGKTVEMPGQRQSGRA